MPLCNVHSDIFDLVTHLSCLLGGKAHSCAWLSLKVKCHSPANLTRLFCRPFAPGTLLLLLSSAAVAEAAPHLASTF